MNQSIDTSLWARYKYTTEVVDLHDAPAWCDAIDADLRAAPANVMPLYTQAAGEPDRIVTTYKTDLAPMEAEAVVAAAHARRIPGTAGQYIALTDDVVNEVVVPTAGDALKLAAKLPEAAKSAATFGLPLIAIGLVAFAFIAWRPRG